ncbi:lysophospholipid acyltransferase family protein [Immundisolibacter cernigliae]|uniref:Acyl-phosphate glycerol 3-phosphate acyltransferase n=1 Tax=Immundisolibacter cernigliae TaxID=1810504 RepID=A0A1B1YUW7_9GAMM|nr:lysophospholipid acyltransferase family protein [Immundisolibacter cernigliae]ANX04507.1 acyl-phosphate glycerol 3-phosphate acyltransferase [Immundisolibacter cernigliae]
MLTFLRSLLFSAGMLVTVIAWGALVPLVAALPFARRYAFTRSWAIVNLRWLELTCGVRYRVIGRENLPSGPVVVLSKHQSTWETLVFQELFPPLVWVMKRELLWVPFFGWGLAMGRPIAIDRGAGRRAMEQMLKQGKQRLDDGLWVVIFPEGTRMNPGQRGRYRPGGALLAVQAGVPVLPVAHNAGELWGKRRFLKHPGTITVAVGTPIATAGQDPAEVLNKAQEWIENAQTRILPAARGGHAD